MRPSFVVTEAVKRAGVKVYYAGRSVTKQWNRHRLAREPLRYGGFYWKQVLNGKQNGDEVGPFRSHSAAVVDAYQRLQLRPASYLLGHKR